MFVKLPGSCRRKAASQRVSLRSQIRTKQSTSGERTRGQNEVEAASDSGHEDGRREKPCPRLHSAVRLIGSDQKGFPTYLHKLALNQLWLPKFSFSSSTSTTPQPLQAASTSSDQLRNSISPARSSPDLCKHTDTIYCGGIRSLHIGSDALTDETDSFVAPRYKICCRVQNCVCCRTQTASHVKLLTRVSSVLSELDQHYFPTLRDAWLLLHLTPGLATTPVLSQFVSHIIPASQFLCVS